MAGLHDYSGELRELLGNGEITLGMGIYDALSALSARDAGIRYLSVSGASVAASLGMPDLGLLTMTEVIERNRQIVNAVRRPVVADADTGYGNAINVMRTVAEFEAAGVAGIHLEDQETPKKCGLLNGIQLISSDEMAGKIRAATLARHNPDFVLVARTDSLRVLGLDEAIFRANKYLDAGADAIMIEGLSALADYREVARNVDAPLIASLSNEMPGAGVSVQQLDDLGYAVAGFPTDAILHAYGAMRAIANTLATASSGTTPNTQLQTGVPYLAELYKLIGTPELEELSQEFAATP